VYDSPVDLLGCMSKDRLLTFKWMSNIVLICIFPNMVTAEDAKEISWKDEVSNNDVPKITEEK